MVTRSGLLVCGARMRRVHAKSGRTDGHGRCWKTDVTRRRETVPALTTVRLEAHTSCAESDFSTRATAERTAQGAVGMGR